MTDSLDRIEALRNPVRMRILAALVEPHTVAEVSSIIGMTPTSIYRHLRRLERLGLVEEVGRERRGKAAATRYRATTTDVSVRIPPNGVGDAVPGMLADAGRDAAAAGDAPWRRIGRTVAAVPPEVAARVADLLESAASALREGDRDDPGDPLVSLSFVLAPLAPSIRTRVALPDDLTHLRRVLYEAVAWNPQRPLPPLEVTLAHPELARYHEGWGRFGDLAVIAEADGAVIGGALCRLFDATDHGHGFVDDHTPELAVAVWRGQRGAGVGTRLLAALEVEAIKAGFEQISLSVDTDNPARRLYLRSGYRPVSQDESGVRMVKHLAPPA